METRLLGYYGEQAAMDYIRHQTDYRIRCCNYRNRMGEIDIIADHGRTLVFIEVKTRRSERYGRPCEAVERRKRQKITCVASGYLKQFRLWDKPVVLTSSKSGPALTISRYPPRRPCFFCRKAVNSCLHAFQVLRPWPWRSRHRRRDGYFKRPAVLRFGGIASTSVKEAKERVRAALRTAVMSFPCGA